MFEAKICRLACLGTRRLHHIIAHKGISQYVVFLAHSCTYPGCDSVLILDGNMKNRRDVCYAKDAGFIQFDGLVGSTKTGCPETPDFKSLYCSQHKSQACDLQSYEEVDDELGVPSGPKLRSHQQKQSAGNPIAEMILAKKTTRKQTYYQVFPHAYIHTGPE